MSVLDGSEEGAVAVIVLYAGVQFEGLDHVFDYFQIPACYCEVQSHLAFGLLELVEHLLQRQVLAVDLLLLSHYLLLQIDEEQFQLSELKCSNCVDDLLECCHYLLVFLEVLAVHCLAFSLFSNMEILFIYDGFQQSLFIYLYVVKSYGQMRRFKNSYKIIRT